MTGVSNENNEIRRIYTTLGFMSIDGLFGDSLNGKMSVIPG